LIGEIETQRLQKGAVCGCDAGKIDIVGVCSISVVVDRADIRAEMRPGGRARPQRSDAHRALAWAVAWTASAVRKPDMAVRPCGGVF